MPLFSSAELSGLLDTLNKLLALTNDFYILTCNQSDLLRREELDELKINLNLRQNLITEIDALHQELLVLMQPYARYEQTLPPDNPTRLKISELQNKIRGLLQDAQQKDKDNTETARNQMTRYSSEGGRMQLGRKTLSHYFPFDNAYEPEYIDKRK